MTAGNAAAAKIHVIDFVRNVIIVSLEPDRYLTVPAIRSPGSQAHTSQRVGVVLPWNPNWRPDISNYLINTP